MAELLVSVLQSFDNNPRSPWHIATVALATSLFCCVLLDLWLGLHIRTSILHWGTLARALFAVCAKVGIGIVSVVEVLLIG